MPMTHIWTLSRDGCNRRRSCQEHFFCTIRGEPTGWTHFPDGIAPSLLPDGSGATVGPMWAKRVSGQTHSWGRRWWQVGPRGQADTLPHQAAHPGIHSEDRGKPRDLTVHSPERGRSSLCVASLLRVSPLLGWEACAFRRSVTQRSAPCTKTHKTHDTRHLLHRPHTLCRQRWLATQPHARSFSFLRSFLPFPQ